VVVADPSVAKAIFVELLDSLRVDQAAGKPRLYKPMAVWCVLEAKRWRLGDNGKR
jgi:hypothetical protein